MSMICCEGPRCNAGRSAADREADILNGMPTNTGELRDAACAYARGTVSKQLAVTPHSLQGSDGHGHSLFRCDYCAHVRVYGNRETVWRGWSVGAV
jgi:hypothetical protein